MHHATKCATPTATSAAQAIHGDRVEWSWSVWCPGCGSAVEICGWGEVPDRVRAAIVARDGLARLRGDPFVNRPQRVAILAVLRRDGMTIGEAVDAFGQLTGAGITGLPVEMRLLADRLTAAGAVVVLYADQPRPPAS
jgi:hypothetical protein